MNEEPAQTRKLSRTPATVGQGIRVGRHVICNGNHRRHRCHEKPATIILATTGVAAVLVALILMCCSSKN